MPYKKKTASEKAGAQVRRFADAMKRVRKSIKQTKKKANENGQEKTERIIENTGKVSGVVSLWMLEKLTRVLNAVLVDNFAVRAMERGFSKWPDIKLQSNGRDAAGKPKQPTKKRKVAAGASRWSRNHPWVASYLTYYAMMAAMVLGGKAGVEHVMNSSDDAQADKIENVVNMNGTIDMSQKIDPQADDFYDKCHQLEDLTAFAICYYETYREHPIQQYGENVYTRGFGMTYSPNSNGKMTVRNYVKTNKKKKQYAHKPVQKQSMDKDVAEALQYLWDQGVYKNIKKHLKRPITVNQFIAICMAGYQLPGHVDDICKKLNNANTQQEIADAYMAGMKVKSGKWGGNIKRRWACAMLAIGKINLPDYMDAYVDGFYALGDNESTYVKNGHFVINDDLCQRSLQVRGNNKHKTSEYLTVTQAGQHAMQQLGISDTDVIVAEQNTPSDSIDKRTSFNFASKKLRNNAHSAGFDVRNMGCDGYDLA